MNMKEKTAFVDKTVDKLLSTIRNEDRIKSVEVNWVRLCTSRSPQDVYHNEVVPTIKIEYFKFPQ